MTELKIAAVAAESLLARQSEPSDPGSFQENGKETAGRLHKFTKPLLVCFSHLRWDFVWQRPQHLLGRAVSQFDVIFIEEPLVSTAALPQLSVSVQTNGVRVAVPCLPESLSHDQRIEAQRRLVASLLVNESRRQIVFWYYTPMAIAFSGDLDRDLTVYDNMDELSAFCGASPELLALEDILLEQADLVFTGGLSLYEAKQGRHSNLHAFPSSVDVAHFARARSIRALRIAGTKSGSIPRLGFFGVIDERLDVRLVDGIAALRPDWQIDMVGPVVKIEAASLPRRPNINWLGARPYADLPETLATWDVGIMPFALNESTRFISPTKTPEFLAAGLGVVSTSITDVVRTYGQPELVDIGAEPVDFVAAASRLLTRSEQPWLARVDRQLATSSWTTTWAAMHTLMMDAMMPHSTLSSAARMQRARLNAARSGSSAPPASMAEVM